MTPTPMDYTRLLQRMKESSMTQTELAKAAGIKPERMKQKLNSLLYFTLKEMRRICEVLEIPAVEISAYFYTPKGDEEIPGGGQSNENGGGVGMKIYSKICKNNPGIKMLAAVIIMDAAYQKASIMELQYAAEIALSAYKETAVVSASCAELRSGAESILENICRKRKEDGGAYEREAERLLENKKIHCLPQGSRQCRRNQDGKDPKNPDGEF